MTEEELLSVLDMSKDEQIVWTKQYCEKEKIDNTRIIPHPDLGEDYEIEGSLADLAFRLRDEVVKDIDIPLEIWASALRKVFLTEFKSGSKITILSLFINCAKPIHWIIAALIAKEKEDD